MPRRSNPKITLPQLVSLVAQATQTTERVSELFLKELFATIKQTLADGRQVAVDGLGTFALENVRLTGGQQSYNRVVFVISPKLAELVNSPFAGFHRVELSDALTDARLAEAETEDIAVADEVAAAAPEAVAPEAAAETTAAAAAPEAAPEAETATAPETAAETVAEVAAAPETAAASPVVGPGLGLAAPECGEQPPVETSEPLSGATPPPFNPSKPDATAESSKNSESSESSKNSETEEEEPLAQRSTEDGKPFWKGFAAGAAAASLVMMCLWLAWWYGTNPINYYASNAGVTVTDTASVASAERPGQARTPQAVEPTNVTGPDSLSSGGGRADLGKDENIAQAVVTDTISRTMYLTSMSRKHYVKPDFWVYIYLENKDKISDPNNVPAGTVMVIPPRDKYDINPDDKASIDKARRIQYEIFTGK
ncbi:MAG: HU family DNA-binding protein [Muribaculaceae bacterium]|nr:HU family DNA-binding protein [Muribaculaceae bacterium]